MSNNGLKVTVEDAKCVQANAFVQSGIFQEFIFKEDSATFRINLNVLLVIKLMLPCLEREGMNLLCKFKIQGGKGKKCLGESTASLHTHNATGIHGLIEKYHSKDRW